MLPEINVNGVTGYLSDVGNVDEMARHALHILGNDDTLKQFKQKAGEHAALFDIHNIIPQYERLYNRFCKCI